MMGRAGRRAGVGAEPGVGVLGVCLVAREYVVAAAGPGQGSYLM